MHLKFEQYFSIHDMVKHDFYFSSEFSNYILAGFVTIVTVVLWTKKSHKMSQKSFHHKNKNRFHALEPRAAVQLPLVHSGFSPILVSESTDKWFRRKSGKRHALY